MNRGPSQSPLLGPGDPSPVQTCNPAGKAPFLLIGDHAGNVIPAALGDLGLRETDLTRHIAWDIGVAGLGERLAWRLDAPFVSQTFSRLVIDCNRDPTSREALVATSDGTTIPGNATLSDADRKRRIAEIHEPYQQAIGAALAAQDAAIGELTTLVSLHSFTPRLGPEPRPWEIGVLHDTGDTRFAKALLASLRHRGDLVVGDNQPYQMDGTDYTVPRHASRRPHVELEIRQDLLALPEQQDRWSDILAEALTACVKP